jgi:poly(hydroxyalkanoate) granule-associated protein
MSKPKLKSKAAPEAAAPTSRSVAGKTIVESAQHIWLAGLGAFSKAQDEGTRLFEALVREGVALEQKTRKLTAGKADEARGVVEAAVGQVKERSQETWDKLEKVFESRVSRALNRLGIPGSAELKGLTARVEELAREVHKLNAKSGSKPAAKSATKPAAAKSGATRSVSRVKDELADVARELESAQLNQASAKRTDASAKKPAVKKVAVKKAAAKPKK